MAIKTTLLSENELIWSPIVANNRMNRERKASGINSYEQEIDFRPEDWLLQRLQTQENVRWLDVCCGKGNALLQVAHHFSEQNLQHKVQLTGLDLVNFYNPIPPNITCLHFETDSIIKWQSSQAYDLITCIHGLHYVGDKLKAITQLANSLDADGLFIANFDVASVFINEHSNTDQVKAWFKQQNIQYQSNKKLMQTSNNAVTSFAGKYVGANDQAGKNYTGQEAVNAYYILENH
ncbi:hypothetical protein BKI52_06730 [marine bacterium AO1-C]|nr:hypothetical protein BKI52_06730 [marine bacterium AO1-C]